MANFTTNTPYVVTLGNQTVSFPDAYCQTQLLSAPGGFALAVTVWDSAASAAPTSGVAPIANPQFPIAITPALLTAVLSAVIAADTDPVLMAFVANLTPA